MTKHVLFTTGYSGLEREDLLCKLRNAGVNVLIDVRDRPQSRKKGFSRKSLEEYLDDNGIQYFHLGNLGVPSENRKKLRDGQSTLKQYFRAFRSYLAKQKEAMAELYELVAKNDCCLFCLESNPQECHRSVVAEELIRMNGKQIRVEHI